MGSRIVVTGVAGFIGQACAQRLAQEGWEVYGIDNFNGYYDPELKKSRVSHLPQKIQERILNADIADTDAVRDLFDKAQPQYVLHLAAQAGVRYSLEEPLTYIKSNIVGHLNVLEACRQHDVEHLVYASSSSVYGLNNIPFDEAHPADHPVSLYGATKRSNELMSHAYAHLFEIPSTGLRFFTVYGPWGRPDMAPWKFINAALRGQSVPLFNYGEMLRDFTYIDDIVEGVIRILNKPPKRQSLEDVDMSPASSTAAYRVFNIGNDAPESLKAFVAAIEKATGTSLAIDLQPLQPGDVLETRAEIHRLDELVGFRPATDLQTGINKTTAWFRSYYQL
ncbi:MAG: SDR family NAD(P)-dependent oxidoreductase [Alphaproteobacteria bacterium]